MPTFERNITGAQAVTDVMEMMGLTAPSSIADSTNPTAKQLWKLATQAGQQLITEADWQFLQEDMTITTVIGQPNYALPSNWGYFTPDAQWNRTTRLPAIGSLREYEWQMLKARNLAGTTFTMLFRVANNEVVFYETPSTVQTIVMPYVSRGWVRDVSNNLRDNLTANDDTILYDSQLFKLYLRYQWRLEKGFDTTADFQRYSDYKDSIVGKDAPARTLSLSQRSGYPYLSILNIPDTGYGT